MPFLWPKNGRKWYSTPTTLLYLVFYPNDVANFDVECPLHRLFYVTVPSGDRYRSQDLRLDICPYLAKRDKEILHVLVDK